MDFWSRDIERGLASVTPCMDLVLLPATVCTPLRDNSVGANGMLVLAPAQRRMPNGFLVVLQQRPGRKPCSQALVSPWAPKAYLLCGTARVYHHESADLCAGGLQAVSPHCICYRNVPASPSLLVSPSLPCVTPLSPSKKKLDDRSWKADDRGRNN